uniref:Uncharacterized protein n=1 Tax=Siphoviridae sp. ctBLh2 TaxID=2827803 RepID=A0A8S5S3C7_9CAUD|nr:MAG TPA: hypothetical protein [Siphoviridae sp. ctBLh2]
MYIFTIKYPITSCVCRGIIVSLFQAIGISVPADRFRSGTRPERYILHDSPIGRMGVTQHRRAGRLRPSRLFSPPGTKKRPKIRQ